MTDVRVERIERGEMIMLIDQGPLFNRARSCLACGVLAEHASLPQGFAFDLRILRSYGDERV